MINHCQSTLVTLFVNKVHWLGEFQLEAKYQVPRDPSLRSCYRASKIARPKLKLHGAWCFGHTFQLAILEENTVHGSAMVQEVLMRTLEAVMQQCKDCHQPLPNTVVVVGDNTVKELKNSVCLSYLASLVNHGRVKFLAHLACSAFVFLICVGEVFIVVSLDFVFVSVIVGVNDGWFLLIKDC